MAAIHNPFWARDLILHKIEDKIQSITYKLRTSMIPLVFLSIILRISDLKYKWVADVVMWNDICYVSILEYEKNGASRS